MRTLGRRLPVPRNLVAAIACLGACLSGCGGGAPVSVSSALLSVSSTGAVLGGHGKLRLTFNNPLGGSADVSLVSTNPTVIGIASTVTVPSGALSAEVDFDAVSLGQSFISATYKDASVLASANVVDKLRVNASGDVHLEMGATTSAYFYLNIDTPDAVDVPITVTDPKVADAPSKITIAPFTSYAYVQITGKGPGATLVSGTLGSHTATITVDVVDQARLTDVSTPGLVEAGVTSTISVSLDAIVGSPATIGTTSSNPAVVVVPTVIVPTGSRSATVDLPILAAGISDLTFALGGSTAKARIAAVDKARLVSFSTQSSVVPGLISTFYVNLDAIVAQNRTVSLTSSDPTVLSIPAQALVTANGNSAFGYVAALKEGDAIITATLDGVSLKQAVHVGYADNTLSIGLRGSTAVVGATNELDLSLNGSSAAGVVTLTSSDPSVAAVPASVAISGSTSLPFDCLKVGTTTLTATVNGLSNSVTLNVVGSPSISSSNPTVNVAVGGTTSAYVYLSSLVPLGTTVTFTSSAPTVAAAPSTIHLANGTTYIPVNVSGLATGTAIISVNIGAATASIVVYVGSGSSPPALFNNIGLAAGSLQVGAATYGYVNMSQGVVTDTPFTLTTSANGIVTLPQMNGVVPAGSSTFYFPIVGAAAGTVDISATVGGVKKSVTVTVLTTPTFTLNVTSSMAVGSQTIAYVQSNCVLPATVSFTVASSNGAVASVNATTVTLPPGVNGAQAGFLVTGLTAGMTTLTAMQGATMLSGMVTVTP